MAKHEELQKNEIEQWRTAVIDLAKTIDGENAPTHGWSPELCTAFQRDLNLPHSNSRTLILT